MLLGFLTPRLTRDKKSSVSPAGSFSLPPLDARGWCDHENGHGRASRSHWRKEAIVALTRPSASESSRKRPQLRGAFRATGLSSALRPG